MSKPDKGRGVVIVDKSNYLKSMTAILSDTSKFHIITDPIRKYTLKIEDKINRFLAKLKKLQCIDDDTYNSLYASGTAPGILYGLPKIHKPDFASKFQYRPILAAYNQASYKISKFLVPILCPLTTNQYTVSNSYEFSKKISQIKDAEKYHMASFDIENLFTSIPLEETIKICIQKLFQRNTSVIGLTKELFGKLLEHAVMNSFFIFSGKFYKQVEGLGMGLPLGPTFANIFMCHHEETWIQDCPAAFKPILYQRYIDDTFLLFQDKSHASLFLNYLNGKHCSINFTAEHESENSLAFLDVLIKRIDNCFTTSVYRKPTFSGLTISYFSHCCNKFKINSIKTLIHRAYGICSNYLLFHRELEFIKQLFHNNGFQKNKIESIINDFLNKKYSNIQAPISVGKKPLYAIIPYFGHLSIQMKIEMSKLISEYFPHLNPQLILVNNFKINSFFKFKDSIPHALCSGIVYKFSCAKCASVYYGSTIRTLYTRVSEHKGLSDRTGKSMIRPKQSSIRDHVMSCGSDIPIDDFKIVASHSKEIDLRILESIFIQKEKPILNDSNSSFPLKLL